MTDNRGRKGSREGKPGGRGTFLDGLSHLIEKLGDLAEKGDALRRTGEFTDKEGKVRGVYGFNIKVGLGDNEVEVEPFGNVRKDARTGKAVVSEITEPLVDVFDEEGHVLVVAEMPGVGSADVDLSVKDDILTIAAEKGEKKYRKEVLLPASFTAGQMTHVCRNGILEVALSKGTRKGVKR